MLTTGIFQTHYVPIPIPRMRDGCEFHILPFGDVHWGAPLHSEDYWKRFCERGAELVARHPSQVFFVGMGDYQDMLSTSERENIERASIHDSTRETIEEWWQKRVEAYAKEIGFMRGRCIGLIEGNHYAQFEDGTTSTMRLCKIIGAKYLGCSCFVRLMFQLCNRHKKTHGSHGSTLPVDLWAHHGKGAAMLSGGSLNTVEKMSMAADADIYLMGHDHRVGTWPSTRLRLRGNHFGMRVEHRDILLVRTGSFLRGYVEGKRSYVADKALNPTQMGWTEIRIKITRSHGQQMKHELHASV